MSGTHGEARKKDCRETIATVPVYSQFCKETDTNSGLRGDASHGR
jgi:hypothetical protein